MPLPRTIGYGVLSVAMLTLGLESTSAAQRRQPAPAEAVGATVSVTGCLLDERTYAAARGLATVSSGGATGPQLVIVPDTSNGRTAGDVPAQSVYALTGVNEAGLRSKVGTRVELTGVVEPGEPTIATGANKPPSAPVNPNAPVGVTPGGSPAHEQGDAVAGASALDSAAAATPDSTPVALGDLARLNVRSSRSRGGSCPQSVAAATPAPASPKPASSRPAESSAPRVAAVTTIDVTGCVSRNNDDGQAFVLKDISVSVPDQRASAVPGSSASGSDSGTLPAAAATGTAGSNAIAGYTLVGSSDLLTPHVGHRVRVTGTIDNAPGERRDLVPLRSETGVRGEVSASGVPHPSAQELRVRTITEAGGRCS